MYLNFFIRSSVNGHSGYFHVLVIVNSAAKNIGVYVPFSVIIFSEYVLSSGIAGLYDSFIPPPFFFKDSPYSSPWWFYQFTFPPTVQESSLFSISSVAFIICRFFYDGQCDWGEVIHFIAVLILTIFWSWEFLIMKFSLIMSLWKWKLISHVRLLPSPGL